MSDTELVKSITDMITAPISEVLHKLTGPWAEEIGLSLGDAARVYRFKRAVRLFDKVRQIADDAGFNPRSVPPHLLLPILEGASIQEDEDLHTRWANLLAHAAKDDKNVQVLPSFPEVLKQLSPAEAELLSQAFWVVHRLGRRPGVLDLSIGHDLEVALVAQPLLEADFIRLGLVERRKRREIHPDLRHATDLEEEYRLTMFGYAFLKACQPPNALL